MQAPPDPAMDYLSFDLRIGEWSPQTHQGMIEVLHSPSGEGRRYPFVLEVDPTAVLRGLAADPSQARRLGRLLANAIFRHEVALVWYESYQIAKERNCGLRLRLHIESWELARLPWELLFDTRADEFMAFDERVSITRYIRLNSAPPVLQGSEALSILVVAASPTDEAPLRWENEIALLREAVEPLARLGKVMLTICEHATRESLHAALVESRPHVVHLIGHAEYDVLQQQGFMVLEDANRRSVHVDATELARLLRRYGTHAVILNACESARGIWAGLAPTLVRADVPAVVAMQWPIEDRAALTFSKAFYRTLAAGRPIDACVSEGRVAIDTAAPHTLMWAAPVLFIRSLDGQLLEPQAHRRLRQAARGSRSGQPEATTSNRQAGPHFRTRGPLQLPEDEAVLVDRPELDHALQIAQQPVVTQYLAILSPRQTGKTTLLLRMMDVLGEQSACVLVDLSVLRGQNVPDCFRLVSAQLAAALEPLKGSARLPAANGSIDSPVAFLDFVQRMARAVHVPRIVLLMDELGALEPEVSDAFFNTVRTIYTQGRGLRNALAKYLFVFSGAVDLYGLTFGTNSPLNICDKLYLQDLTAAQVAQLVGQLNKLGGTVAPEAPEAVYALTGGHPYLAMRLCALLETALPSPITAQTVQRAAAQMLIEDDNIGHLLRALDGQPGARRLLYSILMEGQAVPFSRNNPILASLEMMGAIKPTQPCAVRNQLYERALREYYASPGAQTRGTRRPHR
ncbi:MAG: CHAT domain-containing protein [Anaerolineae bacterium]|jgi:hypothetical protein|nr:CHAT domain-containing protein [Chloroflexota bacterium]